MINLLDVNLTNSWMLTNHMKTLVYAKTLVT